MNERDHLTERVNKHAAKYIDLRIKLDVSAAGRKGKANSPWSRGCNWLGGGGTSDERGERAMRQVRNRPAQRVRWIELLDGIPGETRCYWLQ